MGNSCCGGEEDVPVLNGGRTTSGAPPPVQSMTPTDHELREKMLKAAEERHRQGAVRGTQRKTPKRTSATSPYSGTTGTTGGTDISDWT